MAGVCSANNRDLFIFQLCYSAVVAVNYTYVSLPQAVVHKYDEDQATGGCSSGGPDGP